MTNLDSILRSRDITLPTKVRIVKAMIFLVVLYGYASWTIKKAELKHKLESRLSGKIPITTDMQMTPPLRQKVKKNYKAS